MEATEIELDVPAVRKLLATLELPPELENLQVHFSEDWTGDPGVYISYMVKAGLALTQKDIERLTRFTNSVRAKVIETGTRPFPYVSLQQAP